MKDQEDFATVRRQGTDEVPIRIIEVPGIRLQVTAGPDRGGRWVVPQRTSQLGKSAECDIQLQDPAVSRQHVLLTPTTRGLVIKDPGSTNGTWVKGVRTMEAQLVPGDEFRVGDTTLLVEAISESFRAVDGPKEGLGPLVGGSKAMREVYSLITAVAPSKLGILVTGETGTGKELVARALHEASGRAGPYRIFDCGNTGPEMIRSELFGHEKGAFTGALRERRGALREAEGGTLFLDEIGELPLELQPNLLRILETGILLPMGSDRDPM